MDKISKINIINLKERTDRWKDCLIQLKKYNIENYERFEAIRPDLKKIDPIQYSKNNLKMDEKYIIGALGCKLSHIEIIKNAKKNSYKQILILEDQHSTRLREVYRKKQEGELAGRAVPRDNSLACPPVE